MLLKVFFGKILGVRIKNGTLCSSLFTGIKVQNLKKVTKTMNTVDIPKL